MYFKTGILFLFLAASYAGLVFVAGTAWQAVPLALCVGLGIAGIGFNVQHDGGHGAYSKRRGVNRLMAFSVDIVGGSSYYWNYKHNIAHHTYPNVSGADDDIYLGALARMSPHDPRYPFHRFQHVYMWGLYALLALKWHMIDDFRSLVAVTFGTTKAPRPRGGELALFCAGKVLFVGLAFGLPLIYHPLWKISLLYLLAVMTTGLVLGIVFQLAHCVEEADFPKPAPILDREYVVHQVETTVDFARKNRFLTWFLGGLNFQIEHHLFPRICHVHYPALSPIVERVCAEHGVRHVSHVTARSALRSHYRWLRRMGRPVSAESRDDVRQTAAA